MFWHSGRKYWISGPLLARRLYFILGKNLIMDLDISDIIFLIVVLSIAIALISNSSGGGGHRAPVPSY